MNSGRGASTEPISRKRKELEDKLDDNKRGKMVHPHPSNHKTTSSKAELGWSNRLLAGYMAHEFLTHGTLLGQIFEPEVAEAEVKTKKKIKGGGTDQRKAYGEVACLVKSGDGAHIAGVVNPTQLARWIQM